jgi:hypothetical protein
MTSKPTFPQIKELHETISNSWSGRIALDKEMNELHEMTYEVRAPSPEIENYTPRVIRSGWTRHAIKSFKAMFADKPVFRHEPGIGTASHRQSEKIEGFLNELPWALEAKYGTFWPEAVEDVGKLGRAWVEVLPLRQRWSKSDDYPRQDEEESEDDYDGRRDDWKKNQLPPISIRHLPADGVRAIVTERYTVLQAVRKVTISLADAARRWPKTFQPFLDAKDKPTAEVICWEYADTEWCAWAAEYKSTGELVGTPFKHGMKMCPWVLVEGITTASSDPTKRWEPMLFDSRDVGVAMDAQLTRKAMICEIWPLPFPVIKTNEERPLPGVPKAAPIEIKPPQPLFLYSEDEFQMANWQGAEPEAENLWEKLDAARDRLLPDVGSDIATGATDTAAWTWRLRGQLAERDMKPVADNLSLGAKRIAQAECAAIMSPWIGETVYIRRKGEKGMQAIGIGPEDLKGQMNNIHAVAKISNVMDRNSDIAAARMALEPPLEMPWRWTVETILRVENPQELWDEKLLEKVERSPEYEAMLTRDVMERADMLSAEEAAATPDQIAQYLPQLSPAGQAAASQALGGIPGVGAGGAPVGAAPQSILRTGQTTLTQPGPNPAAPGPGEAMPV